MNQFSKEAKLLHEVDKNTHAMLNLLSRTAAAFVQHSKEVPQEVGQVLGRVQQRRQHFAQVRDILLNQNSGPGVKKVMKRYLEEMKPMTADVEQLLKKLEVSRDE